MRKGKSNFKPSTSNLPGNSFTNEGLGSAGSHTAPGQSSVDPKRAKSARKNANITAGTKVC